VTVRTIGHRGCAAEFPENTVRAVRGSAPHVDAVEVDVRRCGTGELVVFHDETVEGLTAASGRVDELTFEELSSLPVAGSAATVPSLAAVLDAVPPDTGINVEVKEGGMCEEVCSLVDGVDNDVWISSFDAEALSAFRETPLPTAYLFRDSFERNTRNALDLGCEFVHPHYEAVDAERVERAHERGLAVNAWTVPTREEVERLRDAGVDGVIVDSWEIVSG
jgi:glycerophosphoryl diester phosphodiesterase